MKNFTAFAHNLLKWFSENKRTLPWRETNNPYFIWLSEIILQQTRVNQGMDYYHRFAEKFPDIYSLAAASEDEVLKLWEGLGYYTRARNLHKTARIVVEKYNGIFPYCYEELLTLPGIGNYTAAAIASIAFNQPVAVVDGNVKRVVSRILAIQKPIDDSVVLKKIHDFSQKSIHYATHPGDFNQALMELGATLCLPKNPKCAFCPVSIHCNAFKKKLQLVIPTTKEKSSIQERYFIYIVFKDKQNKTLIRQRIEKDIWQHLYEFVAIETTSFPKKISKDYIRENTSIKFNFRINSCSEVFNHRLTHRLIKAVFVDAFAEKLEIINDCDKIVGLNELRNYSFPRLITKYLENHNLKAK